MVGKYENEISVVLIVSILIGIGFLFCGIKFHNDIYNVIGLMGMLGVPFLTILYCMVET